MSQASLYDAILGSGNNLRQIRSANYSPSNTLEPLRVTAGLDAAGHTITQSDPRSRLSTTDIDGFVDLLPATGGLYLASDTIVVPRQLRDAGGTFLSGSNHETIAGTRALIVPQSVSVNQGDKAAVAELEIGFISTTGLLAPVTNNTGVSLASQAFNAEFLLGGFGLDGSQIQGVTGVTINYGIELLPERTDGNIFATTFYIIQRDPSFEVRFVNTAALNAVGPLFAAATSAVIFLRKKASGGTVVADATEEHIAFTFGAGLSEPQQVSASENQSHEVALRVAGRVMTTSSASAIAYS